MFLTLLSSQPAARTGLNLRSGQAPAPAPAIEWRTAAQLAEVQLDRGTFLPEFQGLRDLSHLNFIDQLARSPSPTPMAASAGQQQRQLQAAPNGHLKAVAPSGAKLARPASEKSAGQGERKGPRAWDSSVQPAKKGAAAAAAQPANGARKAGVGKQGQKPAGSDRQAARLQAKPAGLALGSDASKEQSAAGVSHQHHKADVGGTANAGHTDINPESQAKGQVSSTATAKPGRRIKVKIGGKIWNQATGECRHSSCLCLFQQYWLKHGYPLLVGSASSLHMPPGIGTVCGLVLAQDIRQRVHGVRTPPSRVLLAAACPGLMPDSFFCCRRQESRRQGSRWQCQSNGGCM